MSSTTTESIVTVVNKALDKVQWTDTKGNSNDSAMFVLPEFQRDFTWTIQQTLDLFDSIIRNVYIGSLVLGEPSFDIAVRRVDTRKRSRGLKGKKNPTLELELSVINATPIAQRPTLILDGQQRISALTRAMISDQTNDKIYFIAKECPATGRVQPNKDTLVGDLLEFSHEESDDHLAVEIGHVWKLQNGALNFLDTVPILKPLQSSTYYRSLSRLDQASEEKYFLSLMNAIKDMFNAEKIVQVVEINTSLDNFCLFFERSNTAGVKLDFIDILSAKVYTTCRLRGLWDVLESKTNLDTKPAKEPIIRLINYFSQRPDPKKCKEITKGKILEDLTGREINLLFDDISTAWIDTIDWLIENHIIPSQNRLPYPKMVMPIMAYRYSKNIDLASCPADEIEDITKWITTVSLAERYSMKTNERYKTDIKTFVKLATGSLIRNDTTYLNEIKHSLNTEADLIDVTATTGALPKAISNLISYKNQGYVSWVNGKMIPKWNKKDDFQSHHIYPKAFLVSGNMHTNKESIVNRAYIPKLLNIKIGDKDPKKYLSGILKNNSKLDSALTKDFIPLWVKNEDSTTKYQQFLEDRAKSLLNLIKSNTL